MLLIVLPISIINSALVRLNKLSSTVFLVFFPLSIVNSSVNVLKAALTLKVAFTERPFISTDTDKEHQALPFEAAVDEASLVVVTVLEVKDSVAPDLIVLPLTLIGVSVPVIDSSIAFLHSLIEIAFVSISVVANVDTFTVYPVSLPMTVVDRAVLE
jgi:hypothetical protein